MDDWVTKVIYDHDDVVSIINDFFDREAEQLSLVAMYMTINDTDWICYYVGTAKDDQNIWLGVRTGDYDREHGVYVFKLKSDDDIIGEVIDYRPFTQYDIRGIEQLKSKVEDFYNLLTTSRLDQTVLNELSKVDCDTVLIAFPPLSSEDKSDTSE